MDQLACRKSGPQGTKIWRRLGCVKTEFQARTGGADPSQEARGPLNLQRTDLSGLAALAGCAVT